MNKRCKNCEAVGTGLNILVKKKNSYFDIICGEQSFFDAVCVRSPKTYYKARCTLRGYNVI